MFKYSVLPDYLRSKIPFYASLKNANLKRKSYNNHKRNVLVYNYAIVLWFKRFSRIYYTCSKIRLTELTPILTLKNNTVFGPTKWRHFSSKYTDTALVACAIVLCLFLIYLFQFCYLQYLPSSLGQGPGDSEAILQSW